MGFVVNVDQSVRASIRELSVKSMPVVSKLMGVMLLLYSLLYMYIKEGGGITDARWTVICGTTVMIVCSFLILVDFSFNIKRTVGLYAIGLGGNRVFQYINYVFMNTDSEIVTIVLFIYSVVAIGIAVNLCYSGIIFLKGQVRKRVSMILSSMLLFVLMLALIVFLSIAYELTLDQIILSRPDYVVIMCMYIFLIVMLGSKEIRDSSLEEQYISVLRGIRSTTVSSPNAFVYRSVAADLCSAFDDRSKWVIHDGPGPVESQYNFELINRMDDITYVTIQKWKGRDELFFTMSDHKGGSVVNAYRFSATAIIPDGPIDTCSGLDIYGKDTHFRVNIKNDPEKKKWGVSLE